MERVFRKIICLLTMTTLVLSSFPSGVYATSASRSDQEAIAEMAAVAEMEQDLEKRLDTFLAVCSNDESQELAPTPDYSCALEAEALEPLLLDLEAKGGVVSDVANPSCAQVEEVADLPVIEDLKDELTDELQCRREDVEHYKSSCAEEFNCNVLRSGISAAKALPDIIEKPVADYLTSQASEMQGEKHCLDDSRSNCLTEVWTTFIANIKDTAQSFWELGKLGWDSLWNLDEFFDRKSDEVHMAASQTKEDVVTFWKSPGAWAYQQFMKMKDSVEEWMKNSVFCQKWKGTPHMEDSVCEVPLETFGCINCGDMTNAFCAAAGVLASELMIVFATAGAGTAVGTGARIGLRVAGATALKASSKIASVAPKMMRLAPSAAKSSRVARTSKIAVEATIETARVAVRISSEKMAQAKELFIRYKDGLMDTKIAQVAVRTADLASMPMALLDRAAEKGIVASERLMGRMIPGTTGRYMRRREAMRRLPGDDSSPNSRMRQRVQFAMRHQAKSMRHVAGYDGKDTPRSRARTPEQETYDPSSSTKRPPRRSEDFNDRRNERNEGRGRELAGQSEDRSRNLNDRRTKEQIELEARTAERERDRRAQELKAENASNTSHNNEKKSETSTSHLGTALAAADIGVKSIDFSGDDIESAELERLMQEKERGLERVADIKTSEDAIKAIVGDAGTPTQGATQSTLTDSQVRERYQQLQDTYSDENRSRYVENAVATTGISSADAQTFFDRRKSEVDKAGNLLFPRARASAKRSALEGLQAELAGLDTEMDKLEDNLITPLAETKGRRASSLGEDEDEFREDFVGDSDNDSRSPGSNNFFSTPSAVAALAGVGGGGASSVGAHGSVDGGLVQDPSLLAAPGTWEAIRGEEISSNETKILESLISVNALRFVDGEPSEFEGIKKQFGLEVSGVVSHGKIRSSQGEFLFIQTQDKYLVFKKKQGSWIKVQSPSLERLLKGRVVATR